MPPDTVTIRNVELVRAGRWAASTGPTTVTRDDLEAMLAAAQDADVDQAPVRIGHVDPRFDGEPALGWVSNLRLSGDTLVGDLVDVPAKLASAMRAAFRRRSVEIAWGVRTPTGKVYRAALAGLALLGVTPPAVKGLADVLSLYAGTRPAPGEQTVDRVATVEVDDGSGDDDRAGAIAEARFAVATLAAATDAPDETVEALLSAIDGLTAPTPTPPAPPRQEDRMPQMDEARVRELLELEDDADVEAALRELRAHAQGNGGDGTGEQTETPPPAEPATAESNTEAEATAPRTPELATLSAAQLAALERDAAEGREARRILREQENERIITSALAAGRISPADRAEWETNLADERTRDRTVSLLSKLTPVFPTSELGSSDPSAVDVDVDEELKVLFPELRG